MLHIQFNNGNSGKVNLQLLDALGRIVRQQGIQQEGQPFRHQLYLNDLPEGVYTLRIDDGKSVVTERVVKQ